MNHLFCFGMGFTASRLARRLAAEGWRISGTSRDPDKVKAITAGGHNGLLFNGSEPGPDVAAALRSATHILISAAPDDAGDPVLAQHRDDLGQAATIKWIGYLSTVGVYGDFQGAWVDETAPLRPASVRGKRRVQAEAQWLDYAGQTGETGQTNQTGQTVQIFRLAGIYGPGSSPLHKVKNGTAKRIVKPGQVFNRIHVDDIAGALIASMARPNSGAIYNVVDNEPAPPQDVVTYAAGLLGLEPPPEIDYSEADMTPMARSFYGESKRVSNARLKDELGYELKYPTFREGLQALVDGLT